MWDIHRRACAGVGHATGSGWTPDMCYGNVTHLWMGNKPLVEWCYYSGYAQRSTGVAQSPTLGNRRLQQVSNALVFDPLNPAGTTLAAADDGAYG